MISTRLVASVSSLGRLILGMRLYTLALMLVWRTPDRADTPEATFVLVIVIVGLAALVPLAFWDRLVPYVARRSSLLVGDAFIAVGLLFLAGPESPALHFGLTTAAMAGLLRGYRGAIGVCLMLIAGYYLALAAVDGIAGATFTTLLGAPALPPMAAVAGGSVRHLLQRHDRAEDALKRAVHVAAVADERARLAREMHDSLAKTLQGLALSATALRSTAAGTDASVARLAGQLVDASRVASDEARQLIGDLRADRLDQPLERAVGQFAAAWSRATGTEASVDLRAAVGAPLSPGLRYEVLCIVKEALRNVARHAGAATVRVAAHRSPRTGQLVVTIDDDGRGFAAPERVEDLAYQGHYGVVGMAERARRAGGALTVRSAPGQGTTVAVRLTMGEDPVHRPAIVHPAPAVVGEVVP